MEKDMQSKPRLDVMVDMETVSLRENAGILSLALVPFNMDGSDCEEAQSYQVIDLASCYMAGMDMNGCQEWWMQQNEVAKHEIVSCQDKENIYSAISTVYSDLLYMANKYDLHVWSRGTDFDFPKLEWCFRNLLGQEPPYRYYNKRDVRTYTKEFGINEENFEFEGTKHNALDDCRHQIKLVQAAYCISPAANVVGSERKQ